MILKLKYLTIKQNDTEFYLTVIGSSILSKICNTSMNEIYKDGNEDTYQRRLNPTRVNQISQFVQRKMGIMPPAIVLNSKSKIKMDDSYIYIDDAEDQFFIIDGQHRIFGVEKANIKSFEFPVVIMNCIDRPFQDELFVSINNEQKRVNPTVRFRIMANSYSMTPEKAVLNIAHFLSDFDESPFFRLLKFNDLPYRYKTAMLSLSAFASAITTYIYNQSDYYQLKEYLLEKGCVDSINGNLDNYTNAYKYQNKILWFLYKNDKRDIIGKILYNYFSVIKKIFHLSWGNRLYITTKTTGYNAFMLLFKDVFVHCSKSNNNFSFSFMFDLLSGLSKFDEQMLSSKYGSGKAASLYLYREMYKTVFYKDLIDFDTEVINDLVDSDDIDF